MKTQQLKLERNEVIFTRASIRTFDDQLYNRHTMMNQQIIKIHSKKLEGRKKTRACINFYLFLYCYRKTPCRMYFDSTEWTGTRRTDNDSQYVTIKHMSNVTVTHTQISIRLIRVVLFHILQKMLIIKLN